MKAVASPKAVPDRPAETLRKNAAGARCHRSGYALRRSPVPATSGLAYAAHRPVLLRREQTPWPRHFQTFVKRLFEALCVIRSIFEAAEVIYAMRIASLAHYDSYFS